MKKITALILSLILALLLCACGDAPVSVPSDTLGNPDDASVPEGEPCENDPDALKTVTECSSLEELNEALHMNLARPGVMGISDEKYSLINTDLFKYAEYDFSVAGQNYTLIGCPVLGDVSGLYVNGEPAYDEGTKKTEAETRDFKSARWFTIEGQYILTVFDKGTLEKETFDGIVAEMKALTSNLPTPEELQATYDEMAGSYQDSVSQRAGLVAESADGGIKLTVTWSSSAFEYSEWTMTASFAEDGLLYYKNCVSKTVTSDEQGNETVTMNYDKGEGFFGYNEGKLIWNGASDEGCRDCVFEKIPE